MKNKYILFWVVFLVAILISFLSYWFLRIFFFGINQELVQFIVNEENNKKNKQIIVVEIDELTYNKLWFPIDRWDYIPFLEHLSQANPAVIAFDVLFLDKWKDEEKDKKLANIFQKLWNIVIWSAFQTHIKCDTREPFKNGVKQCISPESEKYSSAYNILQNPYELFLKTVKNVWYFQPTIHPRTKKVYSITPFQEVQTKSWIIKYESFSFATLREYYNYMYSRNNTEITGNLWEKVYYFFDKKIPIKKNDFYITYNKVWNFERRSFYDIFEGKFDKEFFKDKIVLIWYTAEWVKDDFFIPGTWAWEVTKGIYIHANIISNILNEDYIVYINEKLEILIAFLFIFFIVYLNIFHLKHFNLRRISFWAIILFVIIVLSYYILFYFVYKSIWIYLLPNYPLEFMSILVFSFFISTIIKYRIEDKNKKMLSKALSEYVSSDIAREILQSTGNVNLSWENKKITIFFSDIAGFTTISEKLSPEKLVSFLRIYLWEMSHIIMDNKWFINKYEWDAIMALWGVFGQVENFWVVDACKSSLLQQAKLKALNEEWKQNGKNELSVRMWLHTGNAIIGNIWAEGRKMEFTALWDSVNLASRLEWVNKFYGTSICVSQDVYQEAKDFFTFRYLDKIRVKWKNIGIDIYELVSYVGEAGVFKENIIKDFEKAMILYQKKLFQEAFDIFSKLSGLWDPPSKTYKKRCEMYLVNPPSEDWDGVWILDEK